MPFKIVQTIERGKHILTTVPDQWEDGGVLFWPKNNKQEKLRKDENSIADYYKWSRIQCIVKRRNIPTFHDAEAEIDVMSNNSETETDNENQGSLNKKKLPLKSFNSMAEEIDQITTPFVVSPQLPTTHLTNDDQIDATNEIPASSDVQEIHQVTAPYILSSQLPNTHFTNDEQFDAAKAIPVYSELQAINQDYVELPIGHNGNTEIPQAADLPKILEELKAIKKDVVTISENQNTLNENQNAMLLQFSKLSTKLEEFIKQSFCAKSKGNSSEFDTLKICNLEDMKQFERKLDQPDLKDELHRQLSLYLNQGIGMGTTNAYSLVDAMFDRKFFLQCSWTGASKGDETKICFKGFTKIINFFFNVVYESDKTFTKAQLVKFFKVVLRNARYRSEKGLTRMSTQRQKSKQNIKTKKKHPALSQENLKDKSSNQSGRSIQREFLDLVRETTQSQSPNALLSQESHRNDSDDD